jgi:hypothetical protein
MLTETITVGGRADDVVLLCRERDLRRELWYDEAGNWLQSRLEDDHPDPYVGAHPRRLVRRIRGAADWPRSPPDRGRHGGARLSLGRPARAAC